MAGALDGIRVIDFGQYVAGPMAAMFLADQGADVVRVDPPGGPWFDTPANATWNRNKRSIVLDLKDPGDLDTATQLIHTADVVIENFRAGVMDRLGLGAAAMTQANPRLVYCSIPGFANDDPRAGVAGWEGVVAAATATYRTNPATGRPVYTAIPISSTYAAFLSVVGVAAALNARERDGVGQVIEAPLFDSTFGAMGNRGLRVHNRPDDADPAAMARMLGWTRQFICKDGRWFMFHAGNLNARAFQERSGASAWLDSEEWERLDAAGQRERIEALFRQRTAAEWEEFCEEVGTEGAVCRTSAEWLADAGAQESGIIVRADDPLLGPIRGPGLNVRLSLTRPSLRTARPRPDADRAAVLGDLGTRASPSAPPPPFPAVPALAGIKVVDLCIILAGPTCGRTLAEFGADVVRIDSPHRPGVAFHNDINRGKRSLVLDLKTEEGLSVFWRLVEDADVVVQNFRRGVAERLGIGYEAVRARRPDIVYASLNTYGQHGRYAGRPGHEQIAQAATGMQERYGGDGRPVLAPFAVNDYGTGLMGAFGVLLALRERRRTGRGQHVDTALAFTATMLQSAYLQDFAGKRWDEPRGQDALGSGPLNRAYQAADGWLFLAGRRRDLARTGGLADLGALEGADLERALEERLAGGTVARWVEALTVAGFGAHRVVDDVRELMDDPWVLAHGLSITREHDGLGPVTTTGPSLRLSRTPPVPGRPAPKPGSDADSVLADVGLEMELDRLVRDKVVVLEGIVAR